MNQSNILSLKNKIENSKLFYNISISIFTLIYFYFYFFALTDFSKDAYYLFRDERLSYDGILMIYQSQSFKEFIENIIFGEDLRYGRLFYNINALTSYIPYLLFHEQGQIIATRLTQFLALFIAYYVFVKVFLKNNLQKLLAFIVLVFLPKTSYFLTEPKPEPLQFLCLSLFLYYGFKNFWKIKPYIIYLGLCIGLKISFIPISAFFILLFTFLNRNEIFLKRKLNLLKILGLFVSIAIILFGYYFYYAESLILPLFGPNSPYILKIGMRPNVNKLSHFLVSFVSDNSFQTKFKLLLILFLVFFTILFLAIKLLSNSFFKLIVFILIGVIICTPCIILLPFNFKYLFSLIFDTRFSLGMDNPLTTYSTWIKYTMDGLCGAPFVLFGSIVIIPLIVIIFKLFTKREDNYFFKTIILFTIFLLSIVPLYFTVHRFFYFYVHFGYVFLIIFYFVAIDINSKNKFSVLLLLPLIFFMFYSLKFSLGDLKKYAERSQPTYEFTQLTQSYFKTVAFLNNNSKTTNVVYWDAKLYFPDHLKGNFTKVIFWENFNDRLTFKSYVNKVRQPNFIVLSRKNTYFHNLIYGCTIKSFNLDSNEINSNDYIKRNIVVDGLNYNLIGKGFSEYLIYSKLKL